MLITIPPLQKNSESDDTLLWYVQYKVLFVEKPGVWLSPDCVHELWLYFGIIVHRNFRVYLWSLITKLISFIGLTKGQVYFIDLNKYIYLTSKVFSAIYFWIWFVQNIGQLVYIIMLPILDMTGTGYTPSAMFHLIKKSASMHRYIPFSGYGLGTMPCVVVPLR